MKWKRPALRKPAVCRRRPEVELGPVSVKGMAGRRNPLGIGVPLVELRLLGVGAVAGRDQERDAVAAARRPPCDRKRGHIGPHRLALPVGERSGVSAPLRFEGRCRPSPYLRLRGRARGNDIAPRSAAPALTSRSPFSDIRTRVGAKLGRRGTATSSARTAAPFGAAHGDRRRPSPRQVSVLREPMRAPVEEARKVIPHRARGRDRREVRRALEPSAVEQRLAQRAKHPHEKQQHRRRAGA